MVDHDLEVPGAIGAPGRVVDGTVRIRLYTGAMSRARPVVAINHSEKELPTFYAQEDLDRLSEAAEVRVLGDRGEPIGDRLADVDVLVGAWGMRKLDPALLEAAPELRAVCYSAGSVKKFVTDEAYARGMVITSAWVANAVPVAEVTQALIVLALKDWFGCQDAIRQARGPEGFQQARARPHVGNYGGRVGLVGFGAIGRDVARRLQAFDHRVRVYDPHVDPAEFAEYDVEGENDLVTLASESDVLSLHAPNIPATEGMMNAEVFRAMPDGATFINTARGKLVVEDDLVAELETGRIQAMLDVTFPEPPEAGHPFYTLPNCWLTPHRAGSTANEIRRMGRYAIDDCLAILAGQPPRHPVTQDMLATMA